MKQLAAAQRAYVWFWHTTKGGSGARGGSRWNAADGIGANRASATAMITTTQDGIFVIAHHPAAETSHSVLSQSMGRWSHHGKWQSRIEHKDFWVGPNGDSWPTLLQDGMGHSPTRGTPRSRRHGSLREGAAAAILARPLLFVTTYRVGLRPEGIHRRLLKEAIFSYEPAMKHPTAL